MPLRSLWVACSACVVLALGCSSSESDTPIPVPSQDATSETLADSSAPDSTGSPDAPSSTDVDASPQETGPEVDSTITDSPLPEAADETAADVLSEGGTPGADCDRLKKLDSDLTAASADAQKLTLIDAFLKDIDSSEGFPVRCGADASFFFLAPSGFAAPHVAGDFNGFDAAKDPMTQIAGAAWRATLPVAAGANRYKYKFTDGTQWLADPHARRFGYDGYGEYSLVSGGTQLGHLERLGEVEGAGLKSRPVTLYLPPAYETSGQTYPVLYAHDGQNLFDPSGAWGSWKLDAAIEGLLAENKVQPFLVVGIHNTVDRMDEYTQVQDDLGEGPVGGKADAYYQLVTNTVMPLAAKHYRLKTGPQNTWTLGSSLGGLISLYFGMKHPEVFGKVAGLSTTAGWGSIGTGIHNQTILELLPTLGKPAVLFYLDSGGGPGSGCVDSDSDGVEDDTADSEDNYCETVQMRDVFETQGYVFDVDLIHWWEPDAEHNEAAWAARVFRPLTALASP